jgi:hypothetical protein
MNNGEEITTCGHLTWVTVILSTTMILLFQYLGDATSSIILDIS